MNLHISMLGALMARLTAAWAAAPPYRAGVAPGPAAWADPSTADDDDHSMTEKCWANQCVQDDLRLPTPPKEPFGNLTFAHPPEVRDNMHGIGDVTTYTTQHLHTGSTFSGTLRHDPGLPHTASDVDKAMSVFAATIDKALSDLLRDPGQCEAARRKEDPQQHIGYPIHRFVKLALGWYPDHTAFHLPVPVTDVEDIWLMQRTAGTESWFSRAKRGFQDLLAKGEGKRAALQLRDRLRECSDPSLHRAIQEHLPDILSSDGQVDDHTTFTSDEWVRFVLEELSRVSGISTEAKQRLLGPLQADEHGICAEPVVGRHGPEPLPFGVFHARMVWPDGTWSTAEDLARAGYGMELEPEPEEEGDDTAMFQAGDRLVNRSWHQLMEQFWQWFSEDRAVQLALAMLRQRTMDRGGEDYQSWASHTLRILGTGIEINEQASQERTPPDFYRWSRRVEWLMYSSYVQEQHNIGDETSMMDRDRYRNGRRRIRDSRSPRRGSCRGTGRGEARVTTEVRRLEGRRPASSGSGGSRPVNSSRTPGRRQTNATEPRARPTDTGERASGSGDRPALSSATLTPSHRMGGFDLPDPQQPMTQQQAVTTWKYLLFDRWAFSPPEAQGVIPTTWLPHDTLQDVSAHLATMNQHNLLVLTTGLVTMIRYLMAELSQSLDMAQVVLNTQAGEPMVDIDAEDDEEEVELMQSFWETGGKDTPQRRWARAVLRLHKELESQPKAQRRQSALVLRGSLPRPDPHTAAEEYQGQLQALLVAILDDCPDTQGHTPAPEPWLASWITELRHFIPGLQRQQLPQLIETQTQLNVSIDELLQDEAEERAYKAALEKQQDDEEEHRAAQARLMDQELQHLASEAMEYREWEQMVEAQGLKRASESVDGDLMKRRCVVTMEVASSSSSRPDRRVHTFDYDLPLDGSPLTFTVRARVEDNPSEVPTVAAPNGNEKATVGTNDPACPATAPSSPRPPSQTTEPVEPQLDENGMMDSMMATKHSQANILGLMEFEEYTVIYDQWRRGELTQQELLAQHGPDVMDLILAQEAVQDSLEGENSEVEHDPYEAATAKHEPDMPCATSPMRARPIYGIFEKIYEAWRDGRMSDGDVLTQHGHCWLSLFQQWKLWGLEAIWSLLDRVLDMEPQLDPTSKEATAARPPEELPLPLRVPFFAVQKLYRKWAQGQVTSEYIRREYGEIWIRLLHRLQTDTHAKLKLGWSTLVDWDAVEDEPHSSGTSSGPVEGMALTGLLGEDDGPQGMRQGPEGIWVRFTMAQFEEVYRGWTTGRLTTEAIRRRHGVDWLALLVMWKTWGRESLWDYLPLVLDVLPDTVAATRPIGAHRLPPVELNLPLRVPWSTVKELLRAWQEDQIDEAEIQTRYGTEWHRVLQKIRGEGVSAHKPSLDLLINWDVPVDEQWMGPMVAMQKGE